MIDGLKLELNALNVVLESSCVCNGGVTKHALIFLIFCM